MPSPDTAPAELLSALSRALAALHAPWYLFGAQAAVVWGRPRLTADVDVTVRLDSDDPDTLVSALEASGFRLRASSSDDFVRRTHVLPFVYLPNGLPVDSVMAGPGLEELFLTRAVQVDVAGVTVPVISPEDLIVTKVLAGRPKDLEDIHGVLRQRGGPSIWMSSGPHWRCWKRRWHRAICFRYSRTRCPAFTARTGSGGFLLASPPTSRPRVAGPVRSVPRA